jgi:CBS domain-containing protein
MLTLIVSVAAFVLLLAFVVAIRAKLGSKGDIKNADILLALVPVALGLFLTGKVQEFAFGEFKIVAAVKDSIQSPVEPQVTKLPVESVQMEAKAGVREIPMLLRRRTQALSFRLGYGGYYGPAIKEYLVSLTQDPFLRYVVINNSDGTFYGLADARQITADIRTSLGPFSAETLAAWLNTTNKAKLQTLPGFISSEKSLKPDSDKREALQLMQALDVQTLPAVDRDGKFIGIVDRSKVTASLLMDIAKRVESNR